MRLDELRGQVVLVNFWATWCGPCREEMPRLDTLYQKYRKSGFVLLGVNVDDDPHTALATAAKLERQLPGAARHRQEGQQAVRPEHHAVDRRDRPRRQDALPHRGYRAGTEGDYEQQIRGLLKE